MEQATTSARVVSVSRQADGVALVRFNRPPANSYDRGFIDDLNAAIDEIRFDASIGAAILTSDLPKFFSAGADIGMFRSVTSKVRAMTILHMHEVLLKIEHTPKIFIAAIGGHCLGGGLEIALAADFPIVNLTPPAGASAGEAPALSPIISKTTCNAIIGRYIRNVTRKNLGKCSI